MYRAPPVRITLRSRTLILLPASESDELCWRRQLPPWPPLPSNCLVYQPAPRATAFHATRCGASSVSISRRWCSRMAWRRAVALSLLVLALTCLGGPVDAGTADQVGATFSLLIQDVVGAFPPVEGLVVQVEGDRLFIDLTEKSGVQPGSVEGATRISPGESRAPVGSRITRAWAVTLPAEAGVPRRSVSAVLVERVSAVGSVPSESNTRGM